VVWLLRLPLAFVLRGLLWLVALGLLAAATVALVLLRIFGDNQFYKTLFDWVVNVFTHMANG